MPLSRRAFLRERENVRHAAVNNDIAIGMRAFFPQADQLLFARKRVPSRDLLARGHRGRHAVAGSLSHEGVVAEKAENSERRQEAHAIRAAAGFSRPASFPSSLIASGALEDYTRNTGV